MVEGIHWGTILISFFISLLLGVFMNYLGFARGYKQGAHEGFLEGVEQTRRALENRKERVSKIQQKEREDTWQQWKK